MNVPLGRITPEQMAGLADLAEKQGDGTLRTAYDQGIVIPNVPTAHKYAAAVALNRLGWSTRRTRSRGTSSPARAGSSATSP